VVFGMAIVMASTLAIAEKKKQAAPDDGAQAQHLKAMDVMALKYDAGQKWESWAAKKKYRGWC